MSICPEVVQNDVFVHPAANGDQEEGLQVCPRSLSVQHITITEVALGKSRGWSVDGNQKMGGGQDA